MKLRIVPERIAAGHPEQNGRHERMHRTLKQETAAPPAANRRAQQRAFDRFRREYNEERAHEALGLETPSAVYTPSARAYPARVPEPEYGSVRRVGPRGVFSWKHQHVFLTETRIGESIGLQSVDERFYTVYFAAFPIATSGPSICIASSATHALCSSLPLAIVASNEAWLCLLLS